MSGRCIIESQQWKIESFVQNLRSIWLEVNICKTFEKKEEGDDHDHAYDSGDDANYHCDQFCNALRNHLSSALLTM